MTSMQPLLSMSSHISVDTLNICRLRYDASCI